MRLLRFLGDLGNLSGEKSYVGSHTHTLSQQTRYEVSYMNKTIAQMVLDKMYAEL